MRGKAVLATTNQGKVAELSGALASFGLTVLGLGDFPGMPEIVEDGASFEENALIKARTVAGRTGLVAVADDSGLEVDALGGAPGIYSARYGADYAPLPGESRDARNIRKLLDATRGLPPKRRCCRFVCCMAAVQPGGRSVFVRGEWPGIVLESPRGENGFGYDPVFFDPDLGRTAAQLSREEKMAVSHRARALRALRKAWANFAA